MRHLNLPIALDIYVTCVATLEIFVGVTALLTKVWTAAGTIALALGLITLWLAHQVAIAPCCREPVDFSLSSAQAPGPAR